MNAGDRLMAVVAGAAGSAVDLVSAPLLSILIFHRVLPHADPLFPGEMHARRFERLMALVARSFTVMTVGEALQRCTGGSLPRRALAITFDDGYADNAEVALPILRMHGLKATFFVATGFLDGGRMFNDTVIETVRAARSDPLDLECFGLGVCPVGTIGQRKQVIQALLPRVKYLPPDRRDDFLHQLFDLAGRPALPDNLMMRSEQVIELNRAGMEIGAHTVRHPILRVLPDEMANAEIADGRRQLQALTGTAVDVFAYPNGRPMQDYDSRHVAMVRRLGFRGAVSTAQGVPGCRADPYQLPRFTPWDPQVHRWLARLEWSRLARRRYDRAEA